MKSRYLDYVQSLHTEIHPDRPYACEKAQDEKHGKHDKDRDKRIRNSTHYRISA